MAEHSEDFGQMGQTCVECSPCWPHRGGYGRCPCDCHPADPIADLEHAMAVIDRLSDENERLRAEVDRMRAALSGSSEDFARVAGMSASEFAAAFFMAGRAGYFLHAGDPERAAVSAGVAEHSEDFGRHRAEIKRLQAENERRWEAWHDLRDRLLLAEVERLREATEIDMLAAYSAALDEVYALRRALAFEASVVEAHTLDLKALGKKRRTQLERAVERMRGAARGESSTAYAGVNHRSLDREMERAGGSNVLTRASWEASLIDSPTQEENR